MCYRVSPLGEDRGTLKQENHMKTISKRLVAASFVIFSPSILVKLFAETNERNRSDTTQDCLEVSCL